MKLHFRPTSRYSCENTPFESPKPHFCQSPTKSYSPMSGDNPSAVKKNQWEQELKYFGWLSRSSPVKCSSLPKQTVGTIKAETKVLSWRRSNFTLSLLRGLFSHEIPKPPSESTCGVFRVWEVCGSAAARWRAAVVSNGRSLDFGTWNTGLEMFSEPRCQTPPLQQCIYCSLPCYCTPLPQLQRTHTHTPTLVERQLCWQAR